MILHQAIVEQTIDRDERGRFVKELVMTRIERHRAADAIPLAMVRKRDADRADREGTRAAVLLVHGYGQNRYAWHLPARSFSNYLAHTGFDVFNLDLRGYGRSRHLGARRPQHVSEYAREDLPAAVAEVVKTSGHDRVYLIGHSLGGLLSYAAGPRLGSSLGGIVSLGSPYLFTRGSWTLRALGGAMLWLDRRVNLGHGTLGLKALGEGVRLARLAVESPLVPLPIRGFDPGSMEPAVLGQHMSLAMDNGSITVLRNMFLAAAEWRESGDRMGWLTEYAGSFEQLDAPLLVIAGTKDDLAPPASVVPAYERSRSRDKTYRSYPRGHIDLIMGKDSPQTIWPLIQAWIAARARSTQQSAAE
jgi:pimeloyl-ACP methyl ester carboxylesterase